MVEEVHHIEAVADAPWEAEALLERVGVVHQQQRQHREAAAEALRSNWMEEDVLPYGVVVVLEAWAVAVVGVVDAAACDEAVAGLDAVGRVVEDLPSWLLAEALLALGVVEE